MLFHVLYSRRWSVRSSCLSTARGSCPSGRKSFQRIGSYRPSVVSRAANPCSTSSLATAPASTATEPSRTEHGPCTRTTLHGRTDAVEPRDGLRSAVRAKPKVRCLFFPEKWIPTGLLSSKPQTNVQSVKRTKCASLAGSGCGPVPGNKPMEMESPGREYRHRYGTVSGSE